MLHVGCFRTQMSVCDVPQLSSDTQEVGVLKVQVTITALCSHTVEQDVDVASMQPDVFKFAISYPDVVSLSGLWCTLKG